MTGNVSFRPTEQDFATVGQGSFRRSLGRRRFRIRMAITALIGFAAGLTLSWVNTDNLILTYGLAGALLALLWLGLIIGGSYLLIPRRSRRLFRQQRSAGDVLHWTWTDSAIALESDRGRTMMLWSEYYDWYENRSSFGFGLNDRLYHFIPKRCLDAGQIADIRACAEASCRRAP